MYTQSKLKYLVLTDNVCPVVTEKIKVVKKAIFEYITIKDGKIPVPTW